MNTRFSHPCTCAAYPFTHRLESGACLRRVFDREAFEERAAIVEFDGGLPRHDAEDHALIEQHQQRAGQ